MVFVGVSSSRGLVDDDGRPSSKMMFLLPTLLEVMSDTPRIGEIRSSITSDLLSPLEPLFSVQNTWNLGGLNTDSNEKYPHQTSLLM